MKVLFVSGHLASDFSLEVEGCYKRTKILLDALTDISEVSILAYVSPESDFSLDAIAKREAEISRFLNAPIRLFLSPKFVRKGKTARIKHQLLGAVNFFEQTHYAYTAGEIQLTDFESCVDIVNPDVVFVHRLSAMPPILSSQKTLPIIFFDLDDIEHIKLSRAILKGATSPFQLLYYLHVLSLKRGEYNAIKKATNTFVCSINDKKYLQKKISSAQVSVIPNSSQIQPVQDLTDEPTLTLLGGYYYPPNRQAADFLIEHVFPIVKQAVPEAQLLIAGRNPDLIHAYKKNPDGVRFLGFIENLDELYAMTRIICCPIFVGGGTRVKMVEAASYGKPIVATKIGAEGIQLTDNESYLMRDSPKDFANACIQLLQDKSLCQKIGGAARLVATENYDRDKIILQIQNHILDSITNLSKQQNIATN